MTGTQLTSRSDYRSPLGNWHSRATVRHSPRHVLEQVGAHPVYFPPELEPATAHPLVLALSPATRWRILIERLHQYLSFTVELEATTVVPVTSVIARGRSGLDLPPGMLADAFKITTDEAWHAQFSYDLMTQIAEVTGVPAPPYSEPAFAKEVARSSSVVPADLRVAHQLLTAVTSETLISALLAELPHDDRLPATVREVVADHAEDEGRHHAYFRALLSFLWPALSVRERRLLGPLVPRLISAFLAPDPAAACGWLTRSGLSEGQVRQVLAESYSPQAIRKTAANAARSTVRYFTEVGALAEGETCAAFAEAGLLEHG